MTDLNTNAILRNLSQLSKEEQSKLYQGMKRVPIKKIFDQAQYLDNDLLPRIKEKHGVDSTHYKFYKEVLDTLLWCAFIFERYNFLQTKFLNNCQLLDFYKERCTKYEAELQKYTTMEDLLMSSSMDAYKEAVMSRINDLKK